jgi:hypothetical protein
MGAILEGPGFEVDGVKFQMFAPTITMQALAIAKDQEAKEEAEEEGEN